MTTLTAPGWASATTVSDLRQLRADVEALGGTFPQSIEDLLAAMELIRTPVETPAVAPPVLDAAAAGELTAAKLAELVRSTALAQADEQVRIELARNAARDIAVRAGSILAEGAADAILDSLRPAFDAAVHTIDQALALVNLDQDADDFVDNADPDALAAYQSLNPAGTVVGRVIGIASRFGAAATAPFPLIGQPTIFGSVPYERLRAIRDDALFTIDPAAGSRVDALSARYRDQASVTATRNLVSPPQLGMRAKVGMYVQHGLRLNTIAEVREVMRAWADALTEASTVPDLVGRLANPYGVDVFPLDD